jgi:hypothetical protein
VSILSNGIAGCSSFESILLVLVYTLVYAMYHPTVYRLGSYRHRLSKAFTVIYGHVMLERHTMSIESEDDLEKIRYACIASSSVFWTDESLDALITISSVLD